MRKTFIYLFIEMDVMFGCLDLVKWVLHPQHPFFLAFVTSIKQSKFTLDKNTKGVAV